MGVRPVNDITAHVTAQVTAEMDPEGMGAHMGHEETLLPLEMERGARCDSMALMNSTMDRFIKESEAREEERKQEFEAFKKEYKLQDEAKEEARKVQDEAKEEARKLQDEAKDKQT